MASLSIVKLIELNTIILMGNGFKIILSNSLKVLEQGTFQEFCLLFLPIFEKRYENLERHGATAGGKTRKGTPDLIKTFSNGRQIAVQCSTEENYWSEPAESENWKPIKDIQKCVEKLKNLQEVVLCSNQEIPTSQPNVKSEITGLSPAFGNITITPFSISNFEEEILNNLQKYSSLIEKFFPELNSYLTYQKDHITLEVYRRRPGTLDAIEEIINKVASSIPGNLELFNQAMEQSLNLRSRFQRMSLPNIGKIKREIDLNSLCPNPLGKVIAIVGLPKIGKTTWVSDFAHLLDQSGIEIAWFDAPFSDKFINEFFFDLMRTIIGKLFSPIAGNEFAEGKTSFEIITSKIAHQPRPNISFQLILDNTENLDVDDLKELLCLSRKVNELFSNIFGIIFIGNKSLKSQGVLVDEEISSPLWKVPEIANLLLLNGLEIKGDLNAYSKLLVPFASGHPLVALAIAKQAPTIELLLPLTMSQQRPALYDKQLTDEVEGLLFNELLSDSDQKNMVIRLSILLSPFSSKLFALLAKTIPPPVSISPSLLMEQLKGKILEGDETIGYQINPIFRSISRKYISEDLSLKVFKTASQYLLSPHKKTLDPIETTDGITYSLLAGDLELGFRWASYLIMKISNKFSKEQLSLVTEGLWMLEALKTPSEDILKFKHGLALLQLALVYSKLDKFARAIRLLRRILSFGIDKIELKDTDRYSFLFFVRLQLVFAYALLGDTPSALKELDNVRVGRLDLPIVAKLALPELASGLISKSDITLIPTAFLIDLVKNARIDDDLSLGSLTDCFLQIGIRIAKSGRSLESVLRRDFVPSNVIWNILLDCAETQMVLEKRLPQSAIERLLTLEEMLCRSGIESISLKRRIAILKGDSYFQLGKGSNALQEYRLVRSLSAGLEENFDDAWALQRIGQLSEAISEALSAFKEAFRIYQLLKFRTLAGKIKGEISILRYNGKDFIEFVEGIESLAEEYYLSSAAEYGPAVAIGLALLTQFKMSLKGEEEKLNKGNFPQIERGIFLDVRDEARPNPGVCTAFFTIGETYSLLGAYERSTRCYNKSLEASAVTELDEHCRCYSAIGIMTETLVLRDFNYLSAAVPRIFGAITFKGKLSESYFAFILFQRVKEHVLDGRIPRSDLERDFEIIENAVEEVSEDRWYRMLSDAYRLIAGIDMELGNVYDLNFLLKAWKFGNKGKRYGIITDFGPLMGFRIESIKEIVDAQLSLVVRICRDQGDIELLDLVGFNMVESWENFEYRRLKTSDLVYLTLRDKAKEMKKRGIPKDLKAPLMLLVLLEVTENMQDEKFDKARKWCLNKIKKAPDLIADWGFGGGVEERVEE